MSTNTFVYKDFKEWKSDIDEMLPEAIRWEFIEKIKEYQDKFKYIDQLGLFRGLYSEFADYSVLKDVFVTTFPLRFPLIRMYHCCRASDTRSYYSKGICVLDSNVANTRFRNLFFKNPSFPQVSESIIEQAINSMSGAYRRHGYVYFGIDDRFLITYCRDYLVYGSEYLRGLAMFLNCSLGCDAKSELKKTGKPTVFEVNIPVGEISEGDMMELADDIFPAWANAVAHDRGEAGELEFAIDIRKNLKREFIVGHYHPDLPDD